MLNYTSVPKISAAEVIEGSLEAFGSIFARKPVIPDLAPPSANCIGKKKSQEPVMRFAIAVRQCKFFFLLLPSASCLLIFFVLFKYGRRYPRVRNGQWTMHLCYRPSLMGRSICMVDMNMQSHITYRTGTHYVFASILCAREGSRQPAQLYFQVHSFIHAQAFVRSELGSSSLTLELELEAQT